MSEIILAILLDPVRAVRQYLRNEPFGACAFTIGMAALSTAVTELLVCRGLFGHSASGAFIIWAFLVNLSVVCVLSVGGLCFISFFVHALGGRVRLGPLTWVVMLSFAPWILSAPLGLAAVAVGGALGMVVAVPGYLALFFWYIGVLSAMISEIGHIDVFRAVLSVAMAFSAAVVLLWAASTTGMVFFLNFLHALTPGV